MEIDDIKNQKYVYSLINKVNNQINKFLKILFVIEIILILIIIVLALNDDKKTITAYVINEIPGEKTDFKTLTKAVCEEKSDYLICHDKLFVKCNEKEYQIENNSNNLIECNNIKINLSELNVNGSTKFRKEWRNST